MKALTANRLIDGEVVFWANGAWVEQFAKAELFYDSAAEDAALGLAKTQFTTVVEPYLFDVAEQGGIFVPVSYRERLRALGPTNEPTHGKQAQGGPEIAAWAKAVGGGHTSGRIDLLRKN
jgi:hypothetical protein